MQQERPQTMKEFPKELDEHHDDPNQASVSAQQLNMLFLLSKAPILTGGAQVIACS